MAQMNQSQVLGVVEEVVLPDSEVGGVTLEYPYEQLESLKSDCLAQVEVDEQIGGLVEVLKNPELDENVVNALVGEINRLESMVCK